MDKLLIIVTDKDDHDMFSNFVTAGYSEVNGLADVLFRNIDGYKIYVISKRRDPKETAGVVTKLLDQNQALETLVCSHKGYMDEGHTAPIHFSHQANDDIGKLLINLSTGGDIRNTFDLLTKKKCEHLIFAILSIFLPLDIDLQALGILANKKTGWAKGRSPADYLIEMYKDNIDFSRKLFDLQGRARELSQEIDKSLFDKLSGIKNENVFKFFAMLDRKETDHSNLLNHNWGIDGVASFHEWFCKLAECLRSTQ